MKIFVSLIVITLLLGAFYLYARQLRSIPPETNSGSNGIVNAPSTTNSPSNSQPSELVSKTRVTKKPFGKYVEPGNSPVENERFTGFHTAADFEIVDDELNEEVRVNAVCSGPIVQANMVSGYGGLIVQDCEFNGQKSKVLYGHIDLDSTLTAKAGTEVDQGETLSILAPAYTPMNGDERKHLHLGILKSDQLDYRGYVQNETELAKWHNPVELLNL